MSDSFEELVSEMMDRKLTTQEWVTNIIRKAILNGYFNDGKPLETTSLADKLGVSRMPVRTALLQLENEGLVTLEPHKKAVATRLSPTEVKKIYQIRYELEALAVRLAFDYITEEDFAYLENLIVKMDNIKEISEFVVLNKKFHNRLSELSKNKTLQNFNTQLRNNVERYLRLYISKDTNIKLANSEHKELLKAFRENDKDKADIIIRKHLLHTCDSVVSFLEKYNSDKDHSVKEVY